MEDLRHDLHELMIGRDDRGYPRSGKPGKGRSESGSHRLFKIARTRKTNRYSAGCSYQGYTYSLHSPLWRHYRFGTVFQCPFEGRRYVLYMDKRGTTGIL